MSVLQKSNRKASARNQIDISGVRDGALILTHERYRAVLHVSPINFELKSEEERDAIIDTYESFLNSIGTRLQILVRTRERSTWTNTCVILNLDVATSRKRRTVIN